MCMCVDGIHDLFSHAHTPCPRELPSPDQLCQPRVGMPELCWQVSTVGIGNQISRRGPQHDLCRRSRYIGPLLGGNGGGRSLSFGSIVQNGKFSAGAADFVSTLKNVDLLEYDVITH